MWDEYALKRNELGHVVLILQLGKMKYWDGTPSIHNTLFGTKMFINLDLLEILSFRQRFKELPEYDESQFKISLFTPQKIHMIHKENGWAYIACKECNKKVSVVESKASSSVGKSKVTFYFEDHGAVQVASRYKVIMRIIDQSGSAPIVFFNTMITNLSGYTAWELMKRHDMDVDEYWPGELLDLVGKRFLFKLYYSDYNVNNNNHTYMCDAVNDDPAMIKHFKEGFLDEEDDDEGFTTPASQLKLTNFSDLNLSRVLDMQTPTSGNEASGSGGSSGSKRVFIDLDDVESEEDKGSGGSFGSKRVFIDLDDIESEEDEGGSTNKTPKMVTVKVEKEDP
ncbi:replication protein A 70 kDa DNA-binding subunit B [Tanacetum coccineum]